MSLPAVFSPAKYDGKVYADGGLLNNLPVDVVKRMGADVVIAVYLNTAPFNAANNQSLFSVMGRSIGVMIAANEAHNIETADLLITAELPKFTASSYEAGADIIKSGYEGAAKKASLLSTLALDESSWQEHLKQRDARRKRTPAVPQFVSVAGIESSLANEIQSSLEDTVGQPVDTNKLERRLNLFSGEGRFSSFSYHQTEVDGKPGLAIDGEERDYAPPFLKFGVLIDGADYNNVLFTLLARVTFMDVLGFRSEWRTDINAGSTWGISSELFKPLRSTRFFVAPRIYAINTPFNLYNRSSQIADYRFRQFGGALDFGYSINRFSELRVGYDAGYFDSALRIGDPTLPTPAGRVGETSIRYNLDKLDSPVVPRSGYAVTARAQWTDAYPGAPAGFPVSELYVGSVRRISKPASVFFQAYGGTTFGHNNTGLPQFFLGGPWRLSAYGLNEIRTNQYFLGKIGYIRELFRLPPLIGNKAYLILDYELAKSYGVAQGSAFLPPSRLPTDAAAALVIDTLFGPLAIGGGYGDTGHQTWWFRLGRVF
jgi:NTE family protein